MMPPVACAFVDGEIVEDDNITALERRRELGLDIGIEGGPVHRPIDDPWGGQAIAAQAGDEGLRSPSAEGGLRAQPFAARGAAAQPRHLGVDGSLVDEDQAMRLTPPDPGLPGFTDVLAFAFRCQQRFFYM